MVGVAEMHLEEPPNHAEHPPAMDSYVAGIYHERKMEREERQKEREEEEERHQARAEREREAEAARTVLGTVSGGRESTQSIGELDTLGTATLGLVRVPSVEATTQSLFTGDRSRSVSPASPTPG